MDKPKSCQFNRFLKEKKMPILQGSFHRQNMLISQQTFINIMIVLVIMEPN